MREYDACYLCLQRARDPLCCSHGHLFCKECIYENILAQKKEIKRKQLLLEARQNEETESAKRKEEEAREALITDFERQQVRIAPQEGSQGKEANGKTNTGATKLPLSLSAETDKRKLGIDEDMLISTVLDFVRMQLCCRLHADRSPL
jgi:nitric oxide synthase-interacting protein